MQNLYTVTSQREITLFSQDPPLVQLIKYTKAKRTQKTR